MKAFLWLLTALFAVMAGGIGGLAWWNGDTTGAMLNRHGAHWASYEALEWQALGQGSFGPITATATLASRKIDGEGEMVTYDVVIPRTTIQTFPSGTITAKGEWRGQLQAWVSKTAGDLRMRPVLRPQWEMRRADWHVSEDEGERLWKLLESEPTEAAFDSRLLYMNNEAAEASPIVYLSALRRLKMWKAATEYAMDEDIDFAMQTTKGKWRSRLIAELHALSRSPLPARDRRVLDLYLSVRPKEPGWSDFKQSTTPGR